MEGTSTRLYFHFQVSRFSLMIFDMLAFQKKHWWEVRRLEDESLSEEHLKSMLQGSVSLLK